MILIDNRLKNNYDIINDNNKYSKLQFICIMCKVEKEIDWTQVLKPELQLALSRDVWTGTTRQILMAWCVYNTNSDLYCLEIQIKKNQ